MKLVVSIIAERELDAEELAVLTSHSASECENQLDMVKQEMKKLLTREGTTSFPRLQVYLAD